ncbi:MAG: flagellar motor protein [gamma proteobacterium symbiont of Bathyaustriella thionipta]|nr:flagellar motor protein [gamma proteobacterium symbiont of Bathyaustriella thionipta]MCU7950338.1 flagellar motor protein [gamma proteobacterium symbiont of Bathyaustriella thionipta]MCU7952959.1 flagellar motor protein [gamma proteobacterium symbiont of Bathyaustriella thionipta]MCU7956868.1 flagellar motor protein [gamma proteobacterium symbiont of Bathyaustriella thionipta]MCU7967221.1 flagellar motor protein [gamma proteobacterium symbiont of Bathyaustriella thionipta]
MDFLSILGLILGVGSILLGQFLDGGHLGTLVNGPAALIVLGGTFGAVMLQSPANVFLRGLKLFSWVFFPPRFHTEETIIRIIDWSNIARKEGLLGLEIVAEEEDLFARKGLELLVDGSEPEVMRSIMELEIDAKESFDTLATKIYEAMGGFSPTISIIGAVMGLIHVMGNLSDPSKLGSGIAVAFVATIYGVGAANLLFIPISTKLKTQVQNEVTYREMIVEGLVSIAEGENPRNIQRKLEGYLDKTKDDEDVSDLV